MGPRVSVALFLRQAVWTVQMIQAEQEPDRTLALLPTDEGGTI